MVKKIFLGALVGAVIAFAWSWASWGILPWYRNVFKDFKNSEEVMCTIRSNATEDGVYALPYCPDECKGKNHDRWANQYSCGPIVFSAVKVRGEDPSMVKNLITHFILLFVVAGLISYVIIHIPGKVKYGERLFFVAVIGLIISLMNAVPNWNWMHYPLDFTLISLMDGVIMWFLAGLGIAKFAHQKNRR